MTALARNKVYEGFIDLIRKLHNLGEEILRERLYKQKISKYIVALFLNDMARLTVMI